MHVVESKGATMAARNVLFRFAGGVFPTVLMAGLQVNMQVSLTLASFATSSLEKTYGGGGGRNNQNNSRRHATQKGGTF